MNAGTCGYYWNGFSSLDVLAIKYVNPFNLLCDYDLSNTIDQAISLDYNGNGYEDVMFYRPGHEFVYLNSSEGDGTFSYVLDNPDGLGGYNFDTYTDRAVSFDYNGDGKDDVFCYRPGSKCAWVLRSNGNGTFTAIISSSNGFGSYNFDSTSDKAVALDYNNDGYDDLLFYRPGKKVVYIFKSNGNGTFTAVVTSSNGLGGYNFDTSTDKVSILDYNGDGYDDVLCYRPGNKVVWLLKSNGNATFTAVITSSNGLAGYNFSSTSDLVTSLNYNGKSDLIFYRPGSGIAYSAHSNGTTFVRDFPSN